MLSHADLGSYSLNDPSGVEGLTNTRSSFGGSWGKTAKHKMTILNTYIKDNKCNSFSYFV